MTRLTGLFLCFACLVLIALQYFGAMKGFQNMGMWNAVSIIYLCGAIFTINGQYQDLCKAKTFAKISRVLATVFYLATAALLVLILLDRFFVITL